MEPGVDPVPWTPHGWDARWPKISSRFESRFADTMRIGTAWRRDDIYPPATPHDHHAISIGHDEGTPTKGTRADGRQLPSDLHEHSPALVAQGIEHRFPKMGLTRSIGAGHSIEPQVAGRFE